MPSEYTARVCSRGGRGVGRSFERDWVWSGIWKLELNIWGIPSRSQSSSLNSNVTSLVTIVVRLCVRFQASSARSDSTNLPGDEAGRDQDWLESKLCSIWSLECNHTISKQTTKSDFSSDDAVFFEYFLFFIFCFTPAAQATPGKKYWRSVLKSLKLRANGGSNSQHCWPNIVRSCCIVCAPLPVRTQQLPTLLAR